MACHACARRLDVKTVQLALPVQLVLLVAHKGRPLQPARRGRGAGSGVGGGLIAWADDGFDVKTSDVWGGLSPKGASRKHWGGSTLSIEKVLV